MPGSAALPPVLWELLPAGVFPAEERRLLGPEARDPWAPSGVSAAPGPGAARGAPGRRHPRGARARGPSPARSRRGAGQAGRSGRRRSAAVRGVHRLGAHPGPSAVPHLRDGGGGRGGHGDRDPPPGERGGAGQRRVRPALRLPPPGARGAAPRRRRGVLRPEGRADRSTRSDGERADRLQVHRRASGRRPGRAAAGVSGSCAADHPASARQDDDARDPGTGGGGRPVLGEAVRLRRP